jgi:hypothetical protein
MPRLTPIQQPHTKRVANLEALLRLVGPVPQSVVDEEQRLVKERTRLRPLKCGSWRDVLSAWHGAVRWRQGLQDILVASLAVATSTQQQGPQVFLLVVGPPGAGKTRLVSSLLVSDSCYPFENLSGIFSGWRSGFGDDDYSVMARINGKTLITPEGDVLTNSRNFDEIMANLRRIFDGSIAQDYKTLKEQRRYDGLRCPIIIAGTPTMMRVMSQPQKGDRFLRILSDKPHAEEERAIVLRAIANARQSVREHSNCSPDTQMSREMTLAYRLTGGFVDHLREHSTELIGKVDRDARVNERLADLAQFTSHLRGRPQVDKRRQSPDDDACRELPGRLGEQFGRVADCAAALLGKPCVDAEVMRLVKKIAIDTCDGKMLQLCRDIAKCGDDGAFPSTLARWAGVTDLVMADRLQYLREVGTVAPVNAGGDPGSDAYVRWRLSDEMLGVWGSVNA